MVVQSPRRQPTAVQAGDDDNESNHLSHKTFLPRLLHDSDHTRRPCGGNGPVAVFNICHLGKLIPSPATLTGPANLKS